LKIAQEARAAEEARIADERAKRELDAKVEPTSTWRSSRARPRS
jgi:hypothetical protein